MPGCTLGEPGAGVIVGSGAGGIDVGEEQYSRVLRRRLEARHALRHPRLDLRDGLERDLDRARPARHQPRALTGCTSSTDAIGYACSAAARRRGRRRCSPGGADACVTPGMIFGFSRMRAVSTRYNDRPAEASRPFDRGRDGFVLGEGAWMLVLEREDRARARGARIYATVDGYGSTCDAYHRVQMDPDGDADRARDAAGASQRRAARPRRSATSTIHGTSTLLNDAVESRCVRRVFGARADACRARRPSR